MGKEQEIKTQVGESHTKNLRGSPGNGQMPGGGDRGERGVLRHDSWTSSTFSRLEGGRRVVKRDKMGQQLGKQDSEVLLHPGNSRRRELTLSNA